MINNKSGFTLVELLVTVAILGILATMAISQFAEYKARGYDSIAKAQVWDAYTAMQASDLRFSKTESFYYNILIEPDGTLNTHVPDSGLSAEELYRRFLPGFNHAKGVSVNAVTSWIPSNGVNYQQSSIGWHEKGSVEKMPDCVGNVGWQISGHGVFGHNNEGKMLKTIARTTGSGCPI